MPKTYLVISKNTNAQKFSEIFDNFISSYPPAPLRESTNDDNGSAYPIKQILQSLSNSDHLPAAIWHDARPGANFIPCKLSLHEKPLHQSIRLKHMVVCKYFYHET